ncbi:MAG: response regulator [Nitrosospira sp.]|nr:response regulator [Nitrosospira sp.]
MNHQLVLLVEPDAHQGGEYFPVIKQHVRSSGLQLASVDVNNVVNRLTELTASGAEPAVVLIGPDAVNPVAVGRRIRAIWPVGQMLFVPGTAQLKKLQRELRHAPLIGPNWSLIEIDDPKLPQKIQRAAHSSQQRLRLRTTLDRANIKLRAPKPVDSLQYRRLTLSEHYLANLLEQSQDAIVSLDTRNTVLYWNTGAERMFKRNAGVVYGMPVAELPFWSLPLNACLEKIHGGIGTLTAEVKCPLPEGDIDLEISFSRVHDNNGSFIGTSLTLRDISLRNRMLQVERTKRREAERASRMKDEFLAVLSHELRTPLSAVIGRTQLLKMRHRNDPELLPALSVIERNAQLQAKLIEDLLDISSVVAGKLHLEMQPVPARQLIEAAVESIRPAADSKQIQLLEIIPPVAGAIHGDPQRLQQVLFNLLANAVKFTPQGGHVEVTLSKNHSCFQITVSDSGIGIDQDYLPFIFDKFGQEDASITRRHGGLGLGLSIAKQLVKLHGGNIQASSGGRDMGASFTVTLPVHSTEAAETEQLTPSTPAEQQGAPTLSGRRILIVEDVADTRQIVTEILQDCGAEVVAVESGLAALAALDSFHPQVLVSDIGMPGMDGYELLKRIRARGFTGEKLPALALTAFASPADRESALLAGYQMHLAKPLIVAELTAAVAQLIVS